MKLKPFIILLLISCFTQVGIAQSRHMLLRDADEAYKNQDFESAESGYRKAKSLSPDVQALFNLGNAAYNQGKFEEAAKYFDEAAAASSTEEIRSNALYNKANALYQQGDLKNALDNYKSTIRINPSDTEARENYMNTLKQLRIQEQQQQEQEQQEQEQEQDNQEQEEQQQEQEQENQEQEEQEQEQEEQQSSQQEEKEEQQQPQASDEKMSKEEVDKLLEMIQREEERMQEKMKGKKSNKKILKDW